MAQSRSQGHVVERDAEGDSSATEAPELNSYEIHDDRTVFTEPDNTDAWIATDETVSLLE
jgi:hypothetical protein